MASGGYRAPTNPAPASGPGRLSKRTDGGPGQKMMVVNGLPYGERQQTLAQERTAPMSQADSIPTPQISAPSGGGAAPAGAPASPVVPLGAPSQRPDEPITHGVDIGPGGSSSVLPVTQQPQFQSQGPMTQMLSQLAATDRTGVLSQLYQQALNVGA